MYLGHPPALAKHAHEVTSILESGSNLGGPFLFAFIIKHALK